MKTSIVGEKFRYITLNENDLITQQVKKTGGFFTVDELEACLTTTQKCFPGLILDIGANIGTFSVPIATWNPAYHVYSFEPQRLVYYCLCGNLAINNLANVTAINCALGDKPNYVDVQMPNYLQDKNIGAFSLLQAEKKPNDSTALLERINISTLDSYDFNQVRFIKIDAEGYELEILIGAIETLKRNNHPPIIFEAWKMDWYQPKLIKIRNLLTSMGYHLEDRGNNILAKYSK